MRLPISAPLALALGLVLAPAYAQQGPNIEKVNGSIHAESGKAYGDLETVNGSIRIGANARVSDAETVNGSIRMEPGAQADNLETVNGSIRIEGGNRVGGLATVNGGVFVGRGGTVGGDVETVNGAIGLVDTDVAGGIETVNGDVTVGVGSHVRGGIRVQKPQMSGLGITIRKKRDPRIVIGPNARVDGPLVFERTVELWVHSTARTGPITGATARRFSTDVPPPRD